MQNFFKKNPFPIPQSCQIIKEKMANYGMWLLLGLEPALRKEEWARLSSYCVSLLLLEPKLILILHIIFKLKKFCSPSTRAQSLHTVALPLAGNNGSSHSGVELSLIGHSLAIVGRRPENFLAHFPRCRPEIKLKKNFARLQPMLSHGVRSPELPLLPLVGNNGASHSRKEENTR